MDSLFSALATFLLLSHVNTASFSSILLGLLYHKNSIKKHRKFCIYNELTVEFPAGSETVQLGGTREMLMRASYHCLWAALGEELYCYFLQGKEMHEVMHEE